MTYVLLILILSAQVYLIYQNSRLIRQGIRMASQLETLKTAVSDLNDATNLVADRIAALSAAVKPGMTDAEVADVQAQMEATAARLKTLAQDPQNPVPVEPPTA